MIMENKSLPPEFNTGSRQMTRGKAYHYFIEMMMNTLKPLQNLNRKQLERSYALVSQELSYEMDLECKKNLIGFMQKMKRVVEVEKSNARHRFDLIAMDMNDEICIIDWKTGQKYPKDIEQLSEYLRESPHVKTGFLVYLDQNEELKIEKDGNTEKEEESYVKKHPGKQENFASKNEKNKKTQEEVSKNLLTNREEAIKIRSKLSKEEVSHRHRDGVSKGYSYFRPHLPQSTSKNKKTRSDIVEKDKDDRRKSKSHCYSENSFLRELN